MFDKLSLYELKELKRALNSIIERRVTFKSTDITVEQDNACLLSLDYKLLGLIIEEIEEGKKEDLR